MDHDRPLFILAGNGPYENRGCEAIVRGTVRILRERFNDPRIVCLSFFQSEEEYREQCRREADDAITHLSTWRGSKGEIVRSIWKPDFWKVAYQCLFDRKARDRQIYRNMLPDLGSAAAVLSIGGDNYSLDYGVPSAFTDLDDFVLAHRKHLVIWGASVGPFGAMPDYERYMGDHLRKITGIFARESATIEYLRGIGVTSNVFPVADPAFLMDPVKPEGIDDDIPIETGAIGINLSPLMAKFVKCDHDAWAKLAASIVSGIAQITELPLYLIPHVTITGSDDNAFHRKVVSLIPNQIENIKVVPPNYSAAETKWIIGKMALFAGARTHATVAALSSGVPTLSFAYSIKAQGINRDIFGHTDFCINPEDLNVQIVNERVRHLIDNSLGVGKEINDRIPAVRRKALSAGDVLKRIIERQVDA